MRLRRFLAFLLVCSMSLFWLPACQTSDDDSDSDSDTVTLSSIAVTPAGASLGKGGSQQYTATGTYSNATTEDLTTKASWTSSDTAKATVSDVSTDTNNPKGLVSAIGTGSATITATYSGVSGDTTVTITSATLSSVQVTPLHPSLVLAVTPRKQFKATGIYTDGTKLDLSEYVTWSSSDTAKATISNNAGQRGLVSNLTAGSTTIKAIFKDTSNDVSGDTILTLTGDTLSSLDVSPLNPSLANGTTLQFTATAVVTDGTTQKTQNITSEVVWTTDTTDDARVSNSVDSIGLATAIDPGSTNVNAAFGSTTATASTLSVTNAALNKLQILPANPSLTIGIEYPLNAKGVYTDGTVYTNQDLTDKVVWSSSDANVATICNAAACKGKVSPVAAGTATITANMPGSITATSSVTVKAATLTLAEIQVTPTNPSIYSGTTQKFTATGIYTDGSDTFHEDISETVVWSSSAETVAMVSNEAGSRGTVRNRSAGTATISARLGTVTGSSSLTILASTMALSAIEVSPANPTIVLGMKQPFRAMGIFSDGTSTAIRDITEEVIWTSGTTTVARISNAAGSKGLAVSVAKATSTITASLGTTSGSSTLTVLDDSAYVFYDLEITPEPATINLAVGTIQKLKAIGIYQQTTSLYFQKVDLTDMATWVSGSPTTAAISNAAGSKGWVKGLSAGNATITAYWTDSDSGGAATKSATKTVAVNAKAIQSIQIHPSHASIALAMEQGYSAKGIYTDGTTYDVYDLPVDLTWRSTETGSTTIHAPISNTEEDHGRVKTLTAGTSTISAALGSTKATETLGSVDTSLQSITLDPANPTLTLGTRQQFRAYGTYADNVNRDITDLVRWSSGTPASAVIRNGPDDHGLATSVATGTSVISAALGSVSKTTTLTVKANTTFKALEVTPAKPVLGAGTSLQLNAVGVFTDTTDYSVDLTDIVYWVSSNESVITVSNQTDTNGRLYGLTAGTATLTAYWTPVTTQKSGSVTVTVTSGTLSSLEISPDRPSGPVGYTEQLTATALYSDNNTQEVTESAVWTSSDNSVVTVSNEAGSRGKITRIAYGSATITARLSSKSATATVTVW